MWKEPSFVSESTIANHMPMIKVDPSSVFLVDLPSIREAGAAPMAAQRLTQYHAG
jgi:hypothetical protein